MGGNSPKNPSPKGLPAMRFPSRLPVCVLLVLTPFTAMRARAQAQAAPDATDVRAATQQLADLARQLGATDALTTLRVWNDMAATRGMPTDVLGNLRSLFETQLTFAVLGRHEEYRKTLTYIAGTPASAGGAQPGRFEGEGSGPLNAFLDAVRNGNYSRQQIAVLEQGDGDVAGAFPVPSGPAGPLSDAQRAALVSSAGAALNNSVPISLWGTIQGGQIINGGFTINEQMVGNYTSTLVDSELPNNASPVGLPPPQAQMNAFGLQEVQKFKSAIGANMGLYNDWVAFDTEPVPGVALNLPVSMAKSTGWKSLGAYEGPTKDKIDTELNTLNWQSDRNAMVRDVRQGNGAAEQAMRRMIRLADTGQQSAQLPDDLVNFRGFIASGDGQDIAHLVGNYEGEVRQMNQSPIMTVGGHGPGAN